MLAGQHGGAGADHDPGLGHCLRRSPARRQVLHTFTCGKASLRSRAMSFVATPAPLYARMKEQFAFRPFLLEAPSRFGRSEGITAEDLWLPCTALRR